MDKQKFNALKLQKKKKKKVKISSTKHCLVITYSCVLNHRSKKKKGVIFHILGSLKSRVSLCSHRICTLLVLFITGFIKHSNLPAFSSTWFGAVMMTAEHSR